MATNTVLPTIQESTTMIASIFDLILTSPILQRALIASLFVAFIAATSGTFMVFRGLSFLTAGVAHAALAGAALGLLLQATGFAPWFTPVLGAVIFAVLMAVLTAYAGERGIAQKMEVAVGVAFALSMSIAVFLMYYLPPVMIPQIWGYLFGDLLLLDNIVLLAGTALSLFLIVVLFKKEFVYVSIDMEGSTAHGMNARGYHYLMIVIAAIAIALAAKTVGAVLVYAILVAPAAASNEVLKTVNGVIIGCFVLALLAMLIGLASSFVILASPSAIAGIIAALMYIIAIQVKRFTRKN
ncbi:MAG: metal ABC transporter permease [Candidatus Hermodarchaeia archaeon]